MINPHGPLSVVLPRVREQLEYHFPDAADFICFANDPDSIKRFADNPLTPARICLKLEAERQRLQRMKKQHHTARHYCGRIYENDEAAKRGEPTPNIWLIHIDELYLEQGDWSLLGTPEMIAEIILWHEIGHSLQLFYRDPLEMAAAEFFNFDGDAIGEQFCDGLVSMMMLKNHDLAAVNALHALSDIRLKNALKLGDHAHYTTPIIDTILDKWVNGSDISSISEIPAIALGMTDIGLINVTQNLRELVRTQEGLDGPAADRLFTALDRSFRLSGPARKAYIDRHDIHIIPGSNSDRTIDFLAMFSFPVIEQVIASRRVHDYFAENKRTDDNMFPGLAAHIRRKTMGGITDQFHWLTAAQSPDFINGILESYYAQMAYEKIGRLLQLREAGKTKKPNIGDMPIKRIA